MRPWNVTRSMRNNLAVLLLVCLASGCGHVRPGGPEDPGDRLRFHDWWNFYERGVKRMLREDYGGALEDMETCLGIRRGARFGYPKDSRFERTYGLHIVRDYFPHRELGVCCYHLGDLKRAGSLLEESLSQQPSARAKYYLNRTRTRLLAGQGLPPPRVELAAPASGRWTCARSLAVSGTAHARGHVASLRVGDSEVFVELAEQALPFRRYVALRPGTNRITVVAGDLLGSEGASELECIADWQPPGMVVSGARREGNGWKIEAACYDDYGVTAVSVNGQKIFRAAPAQGIGRAPVGFNLPPSGIGVVDVVDIAGNTASFAVSAADLVARRHLERAPLVCMAGSACNTMAWPEAAPTAPDTLAPSLQLSVSAATVTCFDDEFYLDGRVEEHSGLRSVEVDGEDLLHAATRELKGLYYFARFVPLKAITNMVRIVATDVAGNATTNDLRVIKCKPEFRHPGLRLSAAILPLRGDPTLGLIVRRRFIDGITGKLTGRAKAQPRKVDAQRFRLVTRDDDIWERIVDEFHLSSLPIVNQEALVRLGEVIPAEYFFAGELVRYADGLEVFMEVVDAVSGEVLFCDDVFVAGVDAITIAAVRAIEERLRGLSSKIKHRFPLLEGKIEHVDGAHVVMQLGEAPGVQDWSRFVVMKPAAKGGIRASRVLRLDGKPVQLRVAETLGDRTEGEVIPGSAARRIEPGDFVYTR